MDLLQVEGNQIVNGSGQRVRLRGTCIGGWMNMENFINGYTGSEHTLRTTMEHVLGKAKATFFFDRMLDYFFAEEDVAFIKSLGATVVRLPLNYRHLEADTHPFQYLESGFERLDHALDWCKKHELYAILDLHAAQGCQNPDWHSDNANRHAGFWQHAHFQDRFVALWQELARRYNSNATVAGYNVLNEPVCNALEGRYGSTYEPNWQAMNEIYRRVVEAIRAIDPDHIIFLEGDYLSTRFSGLEAPFTENLVYSSHNYVEPIQFTDSYPGMNKGKYWDRSRQEQAFLAAEGTQYTRNHDVPLWVGEFGPVYVGDRSALPNRYRALDDQISVIDAHGAHWTTWTYKDVGAMGMVWLDPESDYMQITESFRKKKDELGTDFWFSGLSASQARKTIQKMASIVQETLQEDMDLDWEANALYLKQTVSSVFVGQTMQLHYANLFRGMSEAEMDRVLQSFALSDCLRNEGITEAVRKHTASPA